MSIRTVRAAIAGAALMLSTQSPAAELALPRDGWVSWQVEAVEDSPAWCCWSSWGDNPVAAGSCKLDEDRQGFGARDHTKTDSIRLYARFADGKLERLRALSANCPVESRTPIHDLDPVSTDDSARWLAGLTKDRALAGRHDEFGDSLLAALAVHRGSLPLDTLSDMARANSSEETRKHAIFWLAEVRGIAGADVVSTLMFNDLSAEVRKHAAFAMTQSKSSHIADDLIRLGKQDRVGDVRAQAWFWLAQTGAEHAEEAIATALRDDPDNHVRERAVFALSQLPGDRGTNALISVAEDRSLSHEERKRALFWLGQSSSKVAQAFLDKVLTGAASR